MQTGQCLYGRGSLSQRGWDSTKGPCWPLIGVQGVGLWHRSEGLVHSLNKQRVTREPMWRTILTLYDFYSTSENCWDVKSSLFPTYSGHKISDQTALTMQLGWALSAPYLSFVYVYLNHSVIHTFSSAASEATRNNSQHILEGIRVSHVNQSVLSHGNFPS